MMTEQKAVKRTLGQKVLLGGAGLFLLVFMVLLVRTFFMAEPWYVDDSSKTGEYTVVSAERSEGIRYSKDRCRVILDDGGDRFYVYVNPVNCESYTPGDSIVVQSGVVESNHPTR
jgi:hypothetical protein